MSSTSVSNIALDYAVSPLLTVSNQESASALARKRRREILTSQRALNSTLMLISTLPTVVPDIPTSSLREVSSSSSEDDDDDDSRDNHDDRQVKKRRRHGKNEGTCDKDDAEEVEEDEGIRTLTTSCSKKQPQRKYDPDVPMSREAAALWRREQRRKRNRESAAASRQRQRDRISELEVEVHDFESRYHEVMRRIQALEEEMNHMTTDDLIDSLPTVSPISTITSSTSFLSSSLSTGKDRGDIDSTVVSDSESEKESEPTYQSKMISRQAVKITDKVEAQEVPFIDSMLLPVSQCPDPCLSVPVEEENNTKEGSHESIEMETSIPFFLKEDETEFDSFLLDAVDWL